MQIEELGCGIDLSPSLLQAYLARTLPPDAREIMKFHLDQCDSCHERWNRFRWEQAKGQPGYLEWKCYLQECDEPFVEYLDSSRALITEWRELIPQTTEEREQFFRSTSHYLSNLVIWHESGHRPPYVAEALSLLRQLNAQVICDFGCGIGSDGLQFINAGYQVVFCEFENPASRFLRWRLQQRQLDTFCVEPTHLLRAGSFDTLWTMDVLDHLPNLQALIPLLEQCRIFCYEKDGAQKSHGGPSFHVHHSSEAVHSLCANMGFQQKIEWRSLLAVWYKGEESIIPCTCLET